MQALSTGLTLRPSHNTLIDNSIERAPLCGQTLTPNAVDLVLTLYGGAGTLLSFTFAARAEVYRSGPLCDGTRSREGEDGKKVGRPWYRFNAKVVRNLAWVVPIRRYA